MKKALRWLVTLSVLLLLVPIIGIVLLYAPPIQQAGMEWAADRLSTLSGHRIEVRSVRIRFPLHIEANDIRIDSLLTLKQLTAQIRIRPLLDGKVMVEGFTMEQATLHTDTLIDALKIDGDIQLLRLDDLEYTWKEQRLQTAGIDLWDGTVTMIRQTAHTPKSRNKGRFPLTLSIDKVKVREVNFGYLAESFALASSASQLHIDDTNIDTTLAVSIQSISLDEGDLSYATLASSWELQEIGVQIDSVQYSTREISAVVSACSFAEKHGIRLREGAVSFARREGIVELPYFHFRTDESAIDGQTFLTGNLQKQGMVKGTMAATLGHSDIMSLLDAFGSLRAPHRSPLVALPDAPLTLALSIAGTLDTLYIERCSAALPHTIDLQLSGDIHHITDRDKRQASLDMQARTWDLGFLTALSGTPLTIPDSIAYRGTLAYASDTLHAQVGLTVADSHITLDGGYRPSSKSYSLTAAVRTFDIRQVWPQSTWGIATLQAHIAGKGMDIESDLTSIDGYVHIDSLEWTHQTLTNATLQATLDKRHLQAAVTYADTLMHLHLHSTAHFTDKSIRAQLQADITDINLKALQVTTEEVHPSLQCALLLQVDSLASYSLSGRLHEIRLTTPTRVMNPQELTFRIHTTSDTLSLGMQSSDLHLALRSRTKGLPWQWKFAPGTSPMEYVHYLSDIHADLSVGTDNPVSHYLSLIGINYHSIRGSVHEQDHGLAAHVTISDASMRGIALDSASLTAQYTQGILQAQLQTEHFTWSTPMMSLSTELQATGVWTERFTPDDLSGVVLLSNVRYALPTYSLQLRADTLSVPFNEGRFAFNNLPLYPGGSSQALVLNGHIGLPKMTPTLHLTLTAKGVNLLQRRSPEALLYGSALVNGQVAIEGPYDALSLTGNLSLRTGSSLHYIYKDAMLTSNNQIDETVTFTQFAQQEPKGKSARKRHVAYGFTMDLGINIDPTVQLEILLGGSGQNTGNLQGGGSLNLQYIPASGLRLSGRYTIESGEINMNIPLLHMHQMSIRSGSTIQWSGNATNPMVNLVAEDRIRASVTLDGSPQSVLFLTGVSLSDTMDKLSIQFTLTAPESASMQNTLAALSPEERNKLAVALLTTGLYLGEGGTGNLMNTAIMGFLQSQLDNISRDAFRTVDVSVGIEPLQDGVSGVSTRTDYSFSIAKRFWNDRIRIVIGGSVTTSNERIESDNIIDNISIEWRIAPNGSQYLRFFYDKNYESILEGEIRETGVGYAYRRRF